MLRHIVVTLALAAFACGCCGNRQDRGNSEHKVDLLDSQGKVVRTWRCKSVRTPDRLEHAWKLTTLTDNVIWVTGQVVSQQVED